MVNWTFSAGGIYAFIERSLTVSQKTLNCVFSYTNCNLSFSETTTTVATTTTTEREFVIDIILAMHTLHISSVKMRQVSLPVTESMWNALRVVWYTAIKTLILEVDRLFGITLKQTTSCVIDFRALHNADKTQMTSFMRDYEKDISIHTYRVAVNISRVVHVPAR
jgi:hypothetical protein